LTNSDEIFQNKLLQT